MQITQVALRTAVDTATARNKLPVREKKSPNYDTLEASPPHSNFMTYSVNSNYVFLVNVSFIVLETLNRIMEN